MTMNQLINFISIATSSTANQLITVNHITLVFCESRAKSFYLHCSIQSACSRNKHSLSFSTVL